MAFEAVEKQQSSNYRDEDFGHDANSASSAANSPAAGATAKAGRSRYDLLAALRIVQELDSSAGRVAVYQEILSKNAIYQLVDTLYSRADRRFLQPLLLFIYMLKSVLSMGPFDQKNAEAVAISNFPNEHKTVDRVIALIPDVPVLRVTVGRKHIFRFGQVATILKMLGTAPRLWSFLRLLTRTHSFMPSARIASALAFYIRFAQLLRERPGLQACVVASNYSPEAVGMAAAAHRMGRRVVYANHAPIPANAAVVPPVYADCGLFYGEKTTQIYKARGACTAEVALIGQPGTARAMEWRESIETIGIFLTSGTRVDVLSSLVATIRLSLPQARIIIRQHPVTLLKTDFSKLDIVDDKVALTLGNPLDEEIAACDLVICGNSGVAMNVLSGGRPVAYLSSLDGIHFDANGFVASRLVYSMPWWSDDLYDRLKSFYQVEGWKEVMRSYDAAYGVDLDQLRSEASRVLLSHIRPNACPGAAETAEEVPVQPLTVPVGHSR